MINFYFITSLDIFKLKFSVYFNFRGAFWSLNFNKAGYEVSKCLCLKQLVPILY